MAAAAAVASLTRISPAAACDARCDAMLTGSPSAVKSLDPPVPTTPTKATPVCTPAPNGTQGRSPSASPGAPDTGPAGLGGPDGAPGVAGAGHEGEEQRHDLVPDELLDDRVGLDEDVLGHRVKAVHEPREVPGGHLSSQLARAADVREQHRELHLGAVDLPVLLRDGAHLRGGLDALEAAAADLRVLLPGRVAVAAEHERPRAAERCGAELAPGRRRDEAERALVPQVRVGPAQEG